MSEEPVGGPGQERPCWLDVDLDAIGDNVRSIARLVGNDTRICAVVKAEAYGLGAVEVARSALAAGAERLAVARVDEAIALRRAGIGGPILLIAGFVPAEAEAIVRNRVTATVVRPATDWRWAAGRLGTTVDVHLKVDTGLTRYGAPGRRPTIVALLRGLPTVQLEGLYSHFAAADEADRSFTAEQLHRLYQVVEAIERYEGNGWRPPIVHAANSAATLREPTSWLHMVRVGIALSRSLPRDGRPARRRPPTRPSPCARLLAVNDVQVGTSIGYNRTFVADRLLPRRPRTGRLRRRRP